MSGAWWLSYGRNHNVCGECTGDGELGDGNYIIPCPVCEGTGVVFGNLPKGALLSEEQAEEHDRIEHARMEIRRRLTTSNTLREGNFNGPICPRDLKED